ncbi:uncharacterized protein LOC141629970 [Silene latifolia]|uniref:uncharacterized protein LOC141629970 n=1 Tax=Silene latifolia TaxID=37657 RepID=UPI003D782D0E
MNNHRLGLFGLLETKISGGNVANVTLNLFDGWCVTTNSHIHKGGRVWMLWKPQLFDVHVLAYNPQFIHAKITVKVTGKSFFLTLIYAFNDGKDRLELWRSLKYFAHSCSDPWALAGDFNTVLNPDERLGGQTKDDDMEAFVDCVTSCGMVDIQATGAFFTWTNKQDVEHRKYSRLDRFLVNNEWLTGFPDMIGHFHPEGLFDHNPCVISNKHLVVTKNRSFKYFNMWGGAAVFLPRVKTVWDEHFQGTRMFCIVKKLKQLKPVLKEINKECYADIELKTGEAEQVLTAIQN